MVWNWWTTNLDDLVLTYWSASGCRRTVEAVSDPKVVHPVTVLEPRHDRVVVGFERSGDALDAVEWAAVEAAVRGSSLRIVACSPSPVDVDAYGLGAADSQSLAEVVTMIRRRHPNLSVEPTAIHLDHRDALLDEVADADLVVVGPSGSATATAWLLGLVPRAGARRSAAPVIVVRGDRPQPVRRIVVGVDGSSAAAAAIDWASVEAGRHGAELVVVHALQPGGEHGQSIRVRELARADAQCVVDLAVARCRRRTTGAVHGELIDGPASAVLIRASGEADLLAIGSRGRSGFRTLLFGTVALLVAEHARCPVALTHPQVSPPERRGEQTAQRAVS